MSVPAGGLATARESLLALRALGFTDAAVARSLGRNSSLLSQVARGTKPGANLAPALAELRQRAAALGKGDALPAPTTAPARRQTKGGATTARVRQKDTRSGNGWGTSAVKKQATQNGAGRLAGVLENARLLGRTVAFTVTLDPKVRVRGSGGSVVREKRKGKRVVAQEVDIGESAGGGDPGWWLDRVDEASGDVTEAVRAFLEDSGMAESCERSQVWGLELRTWTG